MQLQPKTPELSSYTSPSTAWEILGASYELARLGDTATSAVFKHQAMVEAGEVAGSKLLSPEELKVQYPKLNLTEPTQSGTAEFLMTDLEDKERLQAVINNGNNTILGKIAGFAGGAIANMTDPLEATVGFATAGVGRLATAGRTLSKGAAFGASLAENILGNVVTESLVVETKKRAGEDYTAADAFNNVVTGTFLFTAGTHAMGSLMKRLGRGNADVLMNQAESALKSGKDPVALLDSTMKHMGDDATDTGFTKAFSDTFPEYSGKDVTVREGFSIIEDKIAAGEMDEAAVAAFDARLTESGFDRTKSKYADPDAMTEFSDDFVAKQSETLNSRESDLLYSKEAAKDYDTIPATPNETVADDIQVKQYETALADSGDTATLEKINFESQLEQKKVGALEGFFNCLIGG